jgi:uncharacterized protein YceK
MKRIFCIVTMLVLMCGCASTDMTAEQASVAEQRANTFVKTVRDMGGKAYAMATFPLDFSVWQTISFGGGNRGSITVFALFEPKESDSSEEQ